MKMLEEFEKHNCKSAMASVTDPYASKYAAKEDSSTKSLLTPTMSDEQELAVPLNSSIIEDESTE